ncbi:MAG: hypothetical protein K8R92_04795 [Planctomycetes bacterium]|nr:hypothetical protein [Planctomycetota bacterium]
MKNRSLFASILAVSAVTAVAQATLVNFTYSGGAANPGIFATGQIDITGINAVTGFVTVTGTSGMDGTYTLIAGSGSNSSFVWDGIFDLNSSTYMTTSGGLEFMDNSGNEINMWANNPSSHSLYGHKNGDGANTYSPLDDGGLLGVVPVPTPGAFALLSLAGLVGSRRRV